MKSVKPIKLIVTSKGNLEWKYEKNISRIVQLLDKLKKADANNGLDTKIVFIDAAKSAKAAGIAVVKKVSDRSCKKAIDDLYKKHLPAYIVILGAQDIIPFQEIDNPVLDEDLGDTIVESDLPYACDAPYSSSIDNFTGPTRVVGRIPDMPGKQKDIKYFKILIENGINHTPKDPDEYRNYFCLSAKVWAKSTVMSLRRMFNESKALILSPIASEKTPTKFKSARLNALTHFYNCHGAKSDPKYYGQKGDNYPTALQPEELRDKVPAGAIVAAECCYGAQLYDQNGESNSEKTISIANTYLSNGAIGLVGSSTIAYGPPDGNANADLITQFFIKSVLQGASLGRAFLEARQRFLSDSGPDLEPYELKTLAQFYLLGDPSVQPAINDAVEPQQNIMVGSIKNARLKMINKGMGLRNMIIPSTNQIKSEKSSDNKKLQEILKTTDFKDASKGAVYQAKIKSAAVGAGKSQQIKSHPVYRTFIKRKKQTENGVERVKVLVVKEDEQGVLDFRIWESK
ncbi:MAG: C25 family cysteine peptidase [Chitinophagaceae bacterium]